MALQRIANQDFDPRIEPRFQITFLLLTHIWRFGPKPLHVHVIPRRLPLLHDLGVVGPQETPPHDIVLLLVIRRVLGQSGGVSEVNHGFAVEDADCEKGVAETNSEEDETVEAEAWPQGLAACTVDLAHFLSLCLSHKDHFLLI